MALHCETCGETLADSAGTQNECGVCGGRLVRTPQRRTSNTASTGSSGAERPVDDEELSDFMSQYGNERQPRRRQRPSGRTKSSPTAAQSQLREDLSVVSTGLIVQGTGICLAVVLALGLLAAWVYGVISMSAATRLAWGLSLCWLATLAGQGMCITISRQSGLQRMAICVLAGCVSTSVLQLADMFWSSRSAVTDQLLGIGVWSGLMFSAISSGLFLMNLARRTGKTVWDTRAGFVLAVLPVAVLAVAGYQVLAPTHLAEEESSTQTVVMAIRFWILLAVVAAMIMYVAVLIGLGRALRRGKSPQTG